MSLIVFLICCLFWYLPVYRKQGREGRPEGKVYIKGILLGAFPVILISLLIQILLTRIFRAAGADADTILLLDALLSAAVTEEGMKFLFARRLVRKAGVSRKIDFILLFGAVGMGFQITESLMGMDGVFHALLRGILAYHVVWQYRMGMYYYDFLTAGETGERKGFPVKALGVPMLLHFVNDYLAFRMDAAVLEEAGPAETFWILAFLGFFVFSVLYLAGTMKKVTRTAKESGKEDLPASC